MPSGIFICEKQISRLFVVDRRVFHFWIWDFLPLRGIPEELLKKKPPFFWFLTVVRWKTNCRDLPKDPEFL